MKLTTNKLLAIALVLSLAIFGLYAFTTPEPTEASTLSFGPTLGAATTTSSVSVTTSTRLMATTTNPLDPTNSYIRAYATICTASTNPVYINMDNDKAAGVGAATTIIAAAAGYNACFEINDRNTYYGSVTASSTGETATVVNVKQYVVQ